MQFNEIAANKKFIIIYLILAAAFVLASFTADNYMHFTYELVFIGIGIAASVLLILFSVKNRKNLHRSAFLIVLFFGLMLVFLSPPMAFPDEGSHFTHSELLSEGVLVPQVAENGYYVSDYYFVLNTAQEGLTVFDNGDFNNPIGQSKSFWPTTTNSPFYAYLLSALGILLAKFLDLTAIWALWLARLFNLLFYAAVLAFLIRTMDEKYKVPFFVIGAVPLLIAQVSSVSYDAFILTFSMVLIAYMLKMYNHEVERSHLAVFFISCLLVSLIKPPYILLALTILIVPKENFRSDSLKIAALAGIAIVFLITFLSFGGLLSGVVHPQSGAIAADATSDVSLQGQMNYILSNPSAIVDMIVFTLKSIPDLFILDLSYYHYADFNGLKFLNLAYFIFFVLFSVFYLNGADLSRTKRALLFIIFSAVFFGIYFIQYLQWTPVGSDYVLGVQARYFLPVIPLIPLIANYRFERLKIKDIDFWLITLAIAFLTGLLIVMVAHYY